jgi:hypothetical protein
VRASSGVGDPGDYRRALMPQLTRLNSFAGTNLMFGTKSGAQDQLLGFGPLPASLGIVRLSVGKRGFPLGVLFNLHKSRVPFHCRPSRRRSSAGTLQAGHRRVSGMRESVVNLLPFVRSAARSGPAGQSLFLLALRPVATGGDGVAQSAG